MEALAQPRSAAPAPNATVTGVSPSEPETDRNQRAVPVGQGTAEPDLPTGGWRPEPFQRDARPLPDEREWLGRLRDGDAAAFARLYERHWAGVHRLLTRLLADGDLAGDVAQEAFVQLYRQPPDGEVPLRPWLYRVAINRGYNALRSDRRRRRREDAVATDPLLSDSGDGQANEAANRADEREAVRRVLAKLPERQRECLVLRTEGLSYAELAVALNVAPGSVGTILARAERAFKEAYLAQRGGM